MATAPIYHSEVTENGDNIQVENTPEYTAFINSQKKAADNAAAKKVSDLARTGMGSKFKEIDDYLSANQNQSEYTDPKTGIVYARYTDNGSGGGGGDSPISGTGETLGYNSFDPKSKMIGIYDTGGNRTSYKKQEVSKGMLSDLMASPIAPILIGVLAPELLPSLGSFAAPAANAALSLAAGKDPATILKNAGLSYIGGQAGDLVKGSESLNDILGNTGTNIVGNVAKSEITSGGKADPLQALISGGLNAGANAIFGQIPGFEGLDSGTQGLIKTAVTSALKSGNKNPASLVSTALQAGMAQLPNATNTPDQATAATENSKFMESLAPYLGGSSSAPKTAATAPVAQPMVGIDPMALLQAQMAGDNGGAQIKSNYNLFGKDLFGPDKASASSTQDRNAPQSDALMAALGDGGYGEQEFSGGGDVHALLQLLRS